MRFTVLATTFSFLLIGVILLISPEISYAQGSGLVPCDGPECNTCHLVQLAERVINFIVTISFVVSALLFAYAGFLFFTGGTSPDKISSARNIFTNTFIGIIIILTAWLVINVILTTLTGQGVNPFTEILCDLDSKPTSQVQKKSSKNIEAKGGDPEKQPSVTSMGSFPILTPEEVKIKASSVKEYASENCIYAQQAGLSSNDCSATLAIMAIESSGNPTTQNESSFGLMQMNVDTAREIDPSLATLSDTEVQDILLKDTSKSIELGTKYYAQQYEKFQDHNLAAAAYNGGPGANDSSEHCSGLRKWECVWDSSGCYGTDKTNCVVNEGYKETRAYVSNVESIRTQLNIPTSATQCPTVAAPRAQDCSGTWTIIENPNTGCVTTWECKE